MFCKRLGLLVYTYICYNMMMIISLNSATYNKQILLSQRKYLIIDVFEV